MLYLITVKYNLSLFKYNVYLEFRCNIIVIYIPFIKRYEVFFAGYMLRKIFSQSR